MLLNIARLKQLTCPVGVDLAVIAIVCKFGINVISLHLFEFDKLLTIHDAGLFGKRLVCQLEIIGNVSHTFVRAPLCGDQNNTVTGSCTINGSRCGIFQDFH